MEGKERSCWEKNLVKEGERVRGKGRWREGKRGREGGGQR